MEKFIKELEKYKFNNDLYVIEPATSQSALIVESKILEHCVRNYAEQMANKKTSIFFIRQKQSIDIPYVTLELRNDAVIQCRGKGNCKPVFAVIEFVNQWCDRFGFRSCFSMGG